MLPVLTQDRDKILTILVIICLVLNTYRTKASSGVDSSCPLFGTTVVVVSLVLVIDRAANYSTASLSLCLLTCASA